MRKAITKRLDDIEKGVSTVTSKDVIRMKVLQGESLTPNEIRVLEADNGLSERVERLLDELDKCDKLYQKQIEDLKTVYESEQIEDAPVEKKDETRRYAGNINPVMESLPPWLAPVDHSKGVQTW